jgi:defect-in-organelle-trafficking protein DotB
MAWIGKPIPYDGPHLANPDAVIPLLAWAARMKVADVSFSTDDPVLVKLKGQWVSVTKYQLNGAQIERILKKITGVDNVIAKVAAGSDYDRAIAIDDPEVKDDFGEPLQHRFRLNLTGIAAGAGLGFHLVLRSINSTPPTIDSVSFPPSLRELFAVTQGSFIIAGSTGSGKSTTFAACLREILEGDTAIKGMILTFEAPVEYMFDKVDSTHSTVKQTEIGVSLPSFAAGVRGALRRHPDLTVIGEVRDRETIKAMTELSMSGHPVFATTHANSCIEIIRRLVENFPTDQYDQMFASIVNASRLFMSQRLVRDQHGEMCVLRDWLYLTNADKRRLLDAGYQRHGELLRELLKNSKRAQSMKVSIDLAYEAGRFSDRQRLELYRTYGEDEGDE